MTTPEPELSDRRWLRSDPYMRIPNWAVFAMIAGITALMVLRGRMAPPPATGPGGMPGTGGATATDPADFAYERFLRMVMDDLAGDLSAEASLASDPAGASGRPRAVDRTVVQPPSLAAVEATADDAFVTVFGLDAFSTLRDRLSFSVNPDPDAWTNFITWMNADPDAPVAPVATTSSLATGSALPPQEVVLLALHIQQPAAPPPPAAPPGTDAPAIPADDDSPPTTTTSTTTTSPPAPAPPETPASGPERTALTTGLGRITWLTPGEPVPAWARATEGG